jgi:ATP-dependent RNA helicase RhlE
MNHQDKIIQCCDCQAMFIYSAEEQARFEVKGYGSEPKRCNYCRRQKRTGSPLHNAQPLTIKPAVITEAPVASLIPKKIIPAASESNFDCFGLHPKVMVGVRGAGYTVPTPIQTQAIPSIMLGRDIIGLAQTGTGKTAAFALPLLHRLMQGPKGRVRVLIISPTRELAEQIYDTFCQLGRSTGLRAMAVYGGVGMEPQISKLRSGYEIVVACPGRLLDHIWRGTINLDHMEALVIDEADRLFDMGFLPDIRSIVKCLPPERQTLLFSATMPSDIRKLVNDVLRDPITVQIGLRRPAETVSHALYPVAKHLKTALLVSLLRQMQTESVLVFTRTKHAAERLADQLASSGFSVASLQGNLSQNQRDRAMDNFRNGSAKIMVATDIAARGLDVLSISHVVNYDMPDSTDTYTHRIGRTGRVEKSGEAFTLVTSEDTLMVQDIEKILGAKIERRTLPGFDYQKSAPPRTAIRPVRPTRRSFARPPARRERVGVR